MAEKKRVMIIGGGPAGLFAAISAARCGARVTLLERAAQLGRKLCASGGGHGNITNTLPVDAFIERFGRNGRFAVPAMQALSRDALLGLLAQWGVPCHATDGFHYLPRSDRARDLLAAACRQLEALGVEVCTGSQVTRVVTKGGRICGISVGKTDFHADAVILAAGGAAYPGLGGSRSGYELAREAGHSIVPLVPGLVGLRTREAWPRDCAGVTIENTEVRILHRSCARRVWRGALLFTHRGLSGPAVLDASASAARLLLDEPEVVLEFRPIAGDLAPARPAALFAGWRREHGRKTVHNLVAGLLPRSLAAAVCGLCGVARDTIMAQLPDEAQGRLASALDKLVVHVTATEGFEQAMVTSGGVSLKEVNPATLESRIVPGLYFAGEILDLDGPCGGFNLQWCASGGWLAGMAAAGGG